MKNKEQQIKKHRFIKEKEKEKEKRDLQKAIASLPKPSFNNPDKIQPIKDIAVPTVIPAIINSPTIQNDNKVSKIADTAIIMDTNTKRIESLSRAKKPSVFRIISRIFSYVIKYWYLLLLAVIFAFVNSAFEILVPLIIGDGIDCIIGVGAVDFNLLTKYIIALAISIIGFALFKWLMARVTYVMSYKIEQRLHNEIFFKFNTVPLKYIDSSSHGDLQSRMVNDVDKITDGFVEGLTTIIDCLATIVFTLVVMLQKDLSISIVILCVTPLSMIVAGIIAKLSHKLFKKQAKGIGDLSGTMAEMVGNQKVVKAFLYEDRSIEKFDEINKKLKDVNEKAIYYSSLSAPFTRFINGLLYATVAIMGCLSALKGHMSVGTISIFLTYANKYARPFNDIADIFADLQAAYASAIRVFNVLDIKNEKSDKGAKVLTVSNGEVEFEHVDFAYTPEKKLIQDLNLNIKQGQRVAIVGPTGCGKSTLINLLMRFYDVDKGAIKVSGEDIRNVTRKSLREQYGMVLQETWLFSASIKENIAYGSPDATLEDVKKAAKMAGVDYFIETLPEGYNTQVTESGDNLSQGQKQLICIARLMLKRPSMLILDEATSNIDTMTEMAIQEAFNKMMKGKTSFVVAHRLSTIVGSDIILVMNKGNVIEQGTHKELLDKKGFYYNLYNSQFENTMLS